MKITVLTENTEKGKGLIAEHGLCLYIECLGRKILFDMGQSDVFLKNAKSLGIDLSLVDIAILSHGHYDHGGGIAKFLEINKDALVYVNENSFGNFYSGTDRYIGISPELKNNPRVIAVGDVFELDKGMKLVSCNECNRPHPFSSFGLFEYTEDGFKEDAFVHEHYLLVHEDGKDILISGCSHKGILNISGWFEYDTFVGGMHLNKLDPKTDEGKQELFNIGKLLLAKKGRYYTGHCTGEEQYEALREMMNDRIEYIFTGTTIFV